MSEKESDAEAMTVTTRVHTACSEQPEEHLHSSLPVALHAFILTGEFAKGKNSKDVAKSKDGYGSIFIDRLDSRQPSEATEKEGREQEIRCCVGGGAWDVHLDSSSCF